MIVTSKKGDWFELIIPSQWEGITLEQLFWEVWKAPRKLTHQFRMEKEVTINHMQAKWNIPLNIGDRLNIRLFQEQDFGVPPTYIEMDILYEDEHLLIANKPPGLKTHPNTPDETETLANAVAFHLQAKGEFRHIKHVHRLDQDTSGVILFSKNKLAGAILDRMLEERQIKRTYEALVQGRMKRKKGTIDAPIGRNRHHPTKRRVSPNGQPAVTHFEVLEFNKNSTKVKCQLDTGRTHQIRVHLSSIGHPIIGDALYGNSLTSKRLALHAARLQFIHPFTLESIEVSSPSTFE